jgi:hypothetical protein
MDHGFHLELILEELGKVAWRPRFRVFGTPTAVTKDLLTHYRTIFRCGLMLGSSDEVDITRILKSYYEDAWADEYERARARVVAAFWPRTVAGYLPEQPLGLQMPKTTLPVALEVARARFADGLVFGSINPEEAQQLLFEHAALPSGVDNDVVLAYNDALQKGTTATIRLTTVRINLYKKLDRVTGGVPGLLRLD